MLLGLLAGLVIFLGYAQPWTTKDERYWSVGLALSLAGGGIFVGMQNAPSVDAMWGTAIGMALPIGVMGLLVGGLIDLSKRSRSKNKVAAPQAPKSSQSQTVAHSSNNAKQTASVDDPYAILGVSPEAEPEVITAAYKTMMRKHELDTARAKKIIEAYAILENAEQGASYDLEAKQSAGKEDAPPPTSAADPHAGGALVDTSAEASPLPPKDQPALKAKKFTPFQVIVGITFFILLIALAQEASEEKKREAQSVQYSLGIEADRRGDHREAIYWYRLAAEQGYAPAQNNLGWHYHEGKGVARDDSEAVRLIGLAANQGNGDAFASLGELYEKGAGVRQDYEEAFIWFELAASAGVTSEGNERAIANFRERVPSLMTYADIAHAQRKIEFRKRAK